MRDHIRYRLFSEFAGGRDTLDQAGKGRQQIPNTVSCAVKTSRHILICNFHPMCCTWLADMGFWRVKDSLDICSSFLLKAYCSW